MPADNKNSNRLLWRYAGLATQFLVVIGVGLFLGLELDKWLKFSMPLMVWVLPLITIVAMIILIVKDTSKKNETNQ